MTQKEFVKAVAADANEKLVAEGKKPITEGTVDTVIKSSVKVTTDALKAGDKIQLNGLGTFTVVDRPAREGRNPITGDTIKIEAKKAPKFKAAKALKDILN